MTIDKIATMVKKGPGCQITTLACAELWGTKEEKQLITQHSQEHDKFRHNTHFAAMGLPTLPSLTAKEFQELSGYAALALAEVRARMNAWCDSQGIIASVHDGGVQFFDKATLDEYKRRDMEEEDAA